MFFLQHKITLSVLLFMAISLSYGQNFPVLPGDSNPQNTENIFPPPVPIISIKDSIPVFDSLHGKLNIFVKNITKIIGTINIAIFNNMNSFMNKGPIFKGMIIPVNAFSMMIPFDSLPKGLYAVAVFHDEDNNGILNTNKMNIPTEGYGFSNNIASNLGPPSFAQTNFLYPGKNKTITINMVYFKFPK